VLNTWLTIRGDDIKRPTEILIIGFPDVGDGNMTGIGDDNVLCSRYSECVLNLSIPRYHYDWGTTIYSRASI
jgi:hypothetical protein